MASPVSEMHAADLVGLMAVIPVDATVDGLLQALRGPAHHLGSERFSGLYGNFHFWVLFCFLVFLDSYTHMRLLLDWIVSS